MNIMECIIKEKKYLSFLHNKKNILIEEKETLKEENKLLTKEINKLSKEEFELNSDINHYDNVDKIIRVNTIMRFIVTLLITILVLKFVPNIYANLLQDLILIPFYFYETVSYFKSVDKEVSFKNNFKIIEKRMDVNNLNLKIKRLKDKLDKHEEKLKLTNNDLNDVLIEEDRHTKYLNSLKDIIENYYLETLKSNLGEDLMNKINYPTAPSLRLKKEN